jgi:hypothetical protein
VPDLRLARRGGAGDLDTQHARGSDGEIVTLCAWSGASGTVNRCEVRLLESGRVGVKREVI